MNKSYTVGPCQFKLGYFKFLVISNSKSFPLDLLFGHLLSVILNSCYFDLFLTFPEGSKQWGSTVARRTVATNLNQTISSQGKEYVGSAKKRDITQISLYSIVPTCSAHCFVHKDFNLIIQHMYMKVELVMQSCTLHCILRLYCSMLFLVPL